MGQSWKPQCKSRKKQHRASSLSPLRQCGCRRGNGVFPSPILQLIQLLIEHCELPLSLPHSHFFSVLSFPAVSQILRKMRMWMWRKRVTPSWSAVDIPSGSQSRTAAMPFLQHHQCQLNRGRVQPGSSKCPHHPTRHTGESCLLVLLS